MVLQIYTIHHDNKCILYITKIWWQNLTIGRRFIKIFPTNLSSLLWSLQSKICISSVYQNFLHASIAKVISIQILHLTVPVQQESRWWGKVLVVQTSLHYNRYPPANQHILWYRKKHCAINVQMISALSMRFFHLQMVSTAHRWHESMNFSHYLCKKN